MKSKKKLKKVKNKIKIHTTPFKFLQYCLVIGDDELQKVCDKFNLDFDKFDKFTSGARLSTFTADDNTLKLSIVRLLEDYRHEQGDIKIHALSALAHEVTHIKQITMESMGEHTPSSEFEAYTIEEIYGNLVQDYFGRV